MNIYLTATLNSKPEFTEEVKAVLQTMVRESRKEKACIQYELHQGIKDKTVFVFQEIWESEEALQEHNQQWYIQDFVKLIDEKLQEAPSIYFTTKL
ncbi:putative quinol monooxygenase [Fluviicola sp.]|uniref:putative quinol monooxygenase n=1 Tax=Fluviicola sp. TaxID=1917219 RepID=UPI003D288AD1